MKPKADGKSDQASVRDRLLDTANDLFYQEGVRAVGVDLVVERSGVAKTSLYRHFATKDDLVAAVLERDDAAFWVRWDAIAREHAGDPSAELHAQLRWIAQYVAGPKYRGCPFLNVATEFPSSDHPARVVALRNKNDLRRRLSLLAKRMKVRKHEALADQLLLLIDGAYVDGQLFGKTGPARSFLAAARALVTAAG
ncbi:MAG TPA: TetR/AcrR family transcriptional regulator [Candidatus Acidoferrales bacterium]|jgi:AcrR family transcriptional regulator|nr:TetR/AcrR family transcriptional regulator [Candidatus Acidoferrales bacterium]